MTYHPSDDSRGSLHDLGEDVLEVRPMRRAQWLVRRHARVDEVVRIDGKIRYRVSVWDEGRQPFLTQWFNDPVPANDFVENLEAQGVRI